MKRRKGDIAVVTLIYFIFLPRASQSVVDNAEKSVGGNWLFYYYYYYCYYYYFHYYYYYYNCYYYYHYYFYYYYFVVVFIIIIVVILFGFAWTSLSIF